MQKKLLQTGDPRIIEDSPEDDFWGWGPNQDGENKLGKIWMQPRKRLGNKEVRGHNLNLYSSMH